MMYAREGEKMHQYYVTGTGTDIGKTFILTHLIKYLKQQHYECMAMKPLISGWPLSARQISQTDTGLICRALGLACTEEHVEMISPFRFHAPLAPSWAMVDEHRHISFAKIVEYCHKHFRQHVLSDYYFVEGAGGLMSPLVQTFTNIDLIQALNMPIILVGGTYLGSISHLLTAIEVCDAYHIPISGVIINQSSQYCVGVNRTVETVQHFHPEIFVMGVQRSQEDFLKDVPLMKLLGTSHHPA